MYIRDPSRFVFENYNILLEINEKEVSEGSLDRHFLASLTSCCSFIVMSWTFLQPHRMKFTMLLHSFSV